MQLPLDHKDPTHRLIMQIVQIVVIFMIGTLTYQLLHLNIDNQREVREQYTKLRARDHGPMYQLKVPSEITVAEVHTRLTLVIYLMTACVSIAGAFAVRVFFGESEFMSRLEMALFCWPLLIIVIESIANVNIIIQTSDNASALALFPILNTVHDIMVMANSFPVAPIAAYVIVQGAKRETHYPFAIAALLFTLFWWMLSLYYSYHIIALATDWVTFF